MKILNLISLWTWQFPQSFLGLIVYLVARKRVSDVDINDNKVGKVYLFNEYKSGVSLGYFVFIATDNKTHVKHELGHLIQSYYLGWFYLLVIGIPSISFNLICKSLPFFGVNKRTISSIYKKFYTEKWADKLGKKYF